MTTWLDRRRFLSGLAGVPLAGLQDNPSMHVLQGENPERLRMDFNTSRGKIRLLFVLSPT
jgi:hypothetical protein